MFTKQELIRQRQSIEQLKHQNSLSPQSAEKLEQSIASSWQRSVLSSIPKERLAAPLLNHNKKHNTSLDKALNACSSELGHIAAQSSMVIAVGDVGSTIIWTASSAQMQSAAEKVHFIAGGQWAEEVVGTNALALSLKTQQSSCVFSNEHYMESIHDWVCYAAPIIDPYSKQVLGVVDLSTTWKKHNSLGVLAAERCASIIQTALIDQQRQHLYIRAFSTPQIFFNGKSLVLTPRQIEILAILVLCPNGSGTYFVGEVASDYFYVPGQPLPHRRSVNWLAQTILRDDMSDALKNSTGSIGTVSTITPHAVEIEKLLGVQLNDPVLVASDPDVEDAAAFAMEKHLEDFLVKNWAQTELGKDYDIYAEDGEPVGQQYPTDTGPMDLLAVKKDKSELLVVELKRGKASDVVVGQVLRYMGFVKEDLAESHQAVRGAIIALEDDLRIRRALAVTPSIQFFRYQISFKLVKT